jgi:TPR repeat protein
MALRKGSSLESEQSKRFKIQTFDLLLQQLESLICPITHQLPVEPYYCQLDGQVYERKAILEWIKKNNISPIDRGCIISEDHLRFSRQTHQQIEGFIEGLKCFRDSHQLNDEKLNSSLSEYESNKIEFEKNKLNKAKLLLEKGIAILRFNRNVTNQESISDIEQAAEMGLAEAQGLLSQIIFEKTKKTDADFSKIIKWSTKAYQSNNKHGCFRLAYAREHGEGIQKDWEEASNIYQKIEDICDVSKRRRALLLFNGGHGLSQDYQNSFKSFDELYNKGNLPFKDKGTLYYLLAKSYYYGLGTDVNLEKTYEILYKSGKEHTFIDESFNLCGELMFNPNFKSLSDEQKYSYGIRLLKRGADLKEPTATRNLEILKTTIANIQFKPVLHFSLYDNNDDENDNNEDENDKNDDDNDDDDDD